LGGASSLNARNGPREFFTRRADEERETLPVASDEKRALSIASGSGGPPGEQRTKAAIAEQQKFSALLKMLRAGLR
jgi:hypothetical protein